MNLTVNQILYITVVSILFLIFNILILVKDKIKSFPVIMIFLSIVVLFVLATLSTIKKN
jgi:hypothetical protein